MSLVPSGLEIHSAVEQLPRIQHQQLQFPNLQPTNLNQNINTQCNFLGIST